MELVLISILWVYCLDSIAIFFIAMCINHAFLLKTKSNVIKNFKFQNL